MVSHISIPLFLWSKLLFSGFYGLRAIIVLSSVVMLHLGSRELLKENIIIIGHGL